MKVGNQPDTRSRVAGHVSVLMARARFNQADLARRLGWPRLGVVRLLNGERPITLEVIEELAEAFGNSPIQFLCEPPNAIWEVGDLKAGQDLIRKAALDDWEAQLLDLRRRFKVEFLAALRQQLHQILEVLPEFERDVVLLEEEAGRELLEDVIDQTVYPEMRPQA